MTIPKLCLVSPYRKLTVLLCDQCTVTWLRKKSQSEFWALIQQGNPQDIIQYSVAMTSQLNQVTQIALTNYFIV